MATVSRKLQSGGVGDEATGATALPESPEQESGSPPNRNTGLPNDFLSSPRHLDQLTTRRFPASGLKQVANLPCIILSYENGRLHGHMRTSMLTSPGPTAPLHSGRPI